MFQGLRFKVAEGAERFRTLELRRQVYNGELGYDPVDEFDDRAVHFITITDVGEIVAGFRILTPDQRPLELEQFLNFSDFMSNERSPGQIGALWVHPDHRRITTRGLLPLGMLKLAFAFASRMRITDLVMRTPVRAHCTFYRRAFFRRLEHLDFKHPVCGNVYVMHLDLLDLEERQTQLQDPVARFLFQTPLPNMEF